jgi:hypothetical protein
MVEKTEKVKAPELPILYKKEEDYFTKRATAWEKHQSKPVRFIVGGFELTMISVFNAGYHFSAAVLKLPVGIFIWGIEDYKGTVKKAFCCFIDIIVSPFKLVSNPKGLIENHKDAFKNRCHLLKENSMTKQNWKNRKN